jgi:hypothetical protein
MVHGVAEKAHILLSRMIFLVVTARGFSLTSTVSFLNSRSSVFTGVLRETNTLIEEHWFVSLEALDLVSSNTDSCYFSNLREVGGDLCLGGLAWRSCKIFANMRPKAIPEGDITPSCADMGVRNML